jgi:microcystin-dependent protein
MSIAIEDLVGSLSLNLVADNNGNVGIGTNAPLEKLDVNGKINIGGSIISKDGIVGQVVYFARNTAPEGWLKCNGATISRTTYAELFNAIGTTFGAGDGESTFQLPDLRGEFIRGWDDGRGVDSGRAFGVSQGDSTKRPNTSFTTNNQGNHNHATLSSGGTFGHQSKAGDGPSAIWSRGPGNSVTSSGGSHTHTITGGGDPETRPKNVSLLSCIKY